MATDNSPKHIGFIMDGNRRWARVKGKNAFFGHKAGTENVEKIIEEAAKKGIKYATFFVLSTENWKKRSKIELAGLIKLLKFFIKSKRERLQKEKARLNILGDISVFPVDLQKLLRETTELLKNNSRIIVNVALNYGGRDEIIRAIEKALKTGEKITEKNFGDFLDTAGQPDSDLIIRTGARNRTSNFLIWQAAYSEIYFSNTLWPDFDSKEFDKILEWYKDQRRTMGG